MKQEAQKQRTCILEGSCRKRSSVLYRWMEESLDLNHYLVHGRKWRKKAKDCKGSRYVK